MANDKKNFNSKKKTTTKKKSTTVKGKTTTTKKKTASTAKKKTNASKGTSTVKKKTTTRKPATKKSVAKTSTSKSAKSKTTKVKITTKEPIKLETEEEKIVLPKAKSKTKEVSKNTNEPKKVIKSEEYTVIKKEPVRYTGKEVESSNNKKKLTKSKVNKIEKAKKSNFKKKLSKLIRKIKIYGINSVFPIKYVIPTILVLILLMIIIPFAINYYGNAAPKMDINAISEKIDQLKTVSFNIDDVGNIIESSESYDGLKDYYEYDFQSMFGLNANHIDQYVIKYNKNKGQVFIAIKPFGEYHDEIKSCIGSFLKENNIKDYDYLEYQGYQIYIKSNNNPKVISKIKQSQIRVFNILQDLKKDEIEKVLKISSGNYSEALVKIAMLRNDTCGYAIFKPSNAYSKENIMNLMNDYYKGLEIKWSNNEENKNLIQNRYFEEYQGYLIYVVSHDNDLVMQLLKS